MVTEQADVCLIVEGAYPYVPGGVSEWVNDLIRAQPSLHFQIVSLVPDRKPRELRYSLPDNVLGLHHVYLQDPQPGAPCFGAARSLLKEIEPFLCALQDGGGLEQLSSIIQCLARFEKPLGRRILIDSETAFETIVQMYQANMPTGSFLHYFWTWRALFGGMFATLISPIPRARVYHSLSTGYAGLFAARARLETGRPAMITEHGIYLNERRVEILMADWLFEQSESGLSIDRHQKNLRDLWIYVFQRYAQLCYEASDLIITLYEYNQQVQLETGAPPEKLKIIPNGVVFDRFTDISRRQEHGSKTVALIGRVVPIKDIKTFLRAMDLLRQNVSDLVSLVLGPTDEDEEYYEECVALVKHLGLESVVSFTGRVDISDYLGRIDILVLTSISEAQPLVILEAGAAGIPVVSTDVGSCRELVHGRSNESPPLGLGGAITPVAAPREIATELGRILNDEGIRHHCGQVMKERVRLYYNKSNIDRVYGDIYHQLTGQESYEQTITGTG